MRGLFLSVSPNFTIMLNCSAPNLQYIPLIMKHKIIFGYLLLCTALLSGQQKEAYLSQNKTALDQTYVFPESNAKLIGFGAYHGSAKTEDAELILLQSVIKQKGVDYYFAETDISNAYYFNQYLKTGNEELLKDLIETYGTRVPQERTINVLEKWKKLKAINDKLPKENKLSVLGADIIVTYKYTYRHLLSIIKDTSKWPSALALKATVEQDTTDFSPYYDSFTKGQLKRFISDYEDNAITYNKLVKDQAMFNYIINGIKTSFMTRYSREKQMYSNYLKLNDMYGLSNKKQFFRLGFSHLLKYKEGNGAPFFSMLIDNGIYKKEEIKSVLGYLTKSEVIWEDVYENGEYVKSLNQGDEGIGDAPNEYFKGIDALKEEATADMCIFKLTTAESPYSTPGCTDLVEVIAVGAKAIDYGTTATTDYIDYAVLISNSPASTSIYTIRKP